MGLYLKMGVGERVIIGGKAIITNVDHRARLFIEGDPPVLRDRDALKEEDADSLCKKIYFLIQSMYLANAKVEYEEEYLKIFQEIQNTVPGSMAFLDQINEMISEGSYYKALKKARALMEYEQSLVGK
jgi:flagellar protein FlbT